MRRSAYSYSCLMAVLPDDLAKQVLKAAKAIPKDRIYDDGTGEKGRADEPHITVKYGIHTDDLAEVLAALKHFRPLKATLGKTSIFWNNDSIVLKISVQSLDLTRLNNLIRKKLECTDTFPNYKPHITLAYVKKDEKNPYWFQEYLTDEFDGMEIQIDRLVFSTPGGKKYQIALDEDIKMVDRISKIASKLAASGYGSQLAQAVVDTHQKIHGWKPEWEVPGMLLWTHPGQTRVVQASPFWRNNHEVVVEVQEEDGTYVSGFDVRLVQTGNLDEDVVVYLKAMYYVWPRIMKIVEMP